MKSWHTDQSGILRGVRYHDGALESLDYVAGDHVRLRIRTTSGELLLVEMAGVVDVFVELWAGAIVSDIFVWPIRAVPMALSIPDSAWNTLLGRRLNEKDVSQYAKDIALEFPEHQFLHILCSYGGNLAAVGQSLTIEQHA